MGGGGGGFLCNAKSSFEVSTASAPMNDPWREIMQMTTIHNSYQNAITHEAVRSFLQADGNFIYREQNCVFPREKF